LDSTLSSALDVSSDSPSIFFRALSIKPFFNVSSGDFSFRLARWEEKSRICNRGMNVPVWICVFAKEFVEGDTLGRRNCLLQSLHIVCGPVRRAALQGDVCVCPRSMLRMESSRWREVPGDIHTELVDSTQKDVMEMEMPLKRQK
jgi:hypothetical protein